MAQNIYDDPDFFAGYRRLPRQAEGLSAAPEWPVLRSMLPALAGKRVVDLGCGFGWAARLFRDEGAASVLAESTTNFLLDAYVRWIDQGAPENDALFLQWVTRSVRAMVYYWRGQEPQDNSPL